MMKTNAVLRLEREHKKPIEDILREMYVDRRMGIHLISKELILSPSTVQKWLKEANIRTRKITFI